MHDTIEKLGQYAGSSTLAAFAELLSGREVEKKVRFNERSAGLVVEDKFLVTVGEDILRFELAVELLGHLVANLLVGLAEEMEFFAWKLEIALLVTKVGKSFGSYDGSFWICLREDCQHLPVLRCLVRNRLLCAKPRGRCGAPDPVRSGT